MTTISFDTKAFDRLIKKYAAILPRVWSANTPPPRVPNQPDDRSLEAFVAWIRLDTAALTRKPIKRTPPFPIDYRSLSESCTRYWESVDRERARAQAE